MDRESKAVEKAVSSSNDISFSSHGPAASARPLHLQTMDRESEAVENAVSSSNGVSLSSHGHAASARPLHRQTMDRESEAVEKAVLSSNGISFSSHGHAASARPLHLQSMERESNEYVEPPELLESDSWFHTQHNAGSRLKNCDHGLRRKTWKETRRPQPKLPMCSTIDAATLLPLKPGQIAGLKLSAR